MKIVVSQLDLLKTDNSSQPVMQVLQDKGAPIQGTFFLALEDGWEVNRMQEAETGNLVFDFKRVGESDMKKKTKAKSKKTVSATAKVVLGLRITTLVLALTALGVSICTYFGVYLF